MNFERARMIAETLLRYYLPTGYQFKFTSAMMRFGYCVVMQLMESGIKNLC